jgi:Protein of unknown function (DUF3570)
VEVAVAVTDIKPIGSLGGAVLLAAMTLPGLTPTSALAENPPERATVSYKYLSYKDRQPGLDRISVRAHSAEAVVPLGSEWSFTISGVHDSVSGASPRSYTNLTSSATKMRDSRTGYDGSVTYYRPRSSYSVAAAQSKEHDYYSKAASISATFSSEDQNTTYNIGTGISDDRISNSIDSDIRGRKHTNDLLVGVTQALSKTDLLQFNLGFVVGRGDFNDHYKTNIVEDRRPDRREQLTQLIRWNHHFESMGTTLRTSYRHYSDTWKLESHTLQLTPLLRYYSQKAAYFYQDATRVVSGSARPPAATFSNDPEDPRYVQYASSDQRLSTFGGVTIGLRADYEITKDLSVDARADWYKQRSDWRMSGDASQFVAPFEAKMFQVGVKYGF